MHLHILLTADHAYIDNATGKLYILGAFNNISVAQFPCRHEKMALVVRIGSDVTDRTNEQILTAILMDEDSHEILKLSIPITPKPADRALHNHPHDYKFIEPKSGNDGEMPDLNLQMAIFSV